MSEPNQAFNPYAADQMPEGGGLTRDIVVTSAKYVIYPMTRKSGEAVIDDKTGQQSFFVGLRIEGLSTDPKAEGKVGKYEWSSGKKAKPSADGEMLVDESGNPAKVYQTSNLGKAINALRKGGFDVTTLYPRVSVLVGSKITLTGLDKKGADGKVKTHVFEGKTYNDIEWFPEKYNGGAGTRVAAGNGAGKSADELTTKAEAAVVAAIAEAGGTIERKDLIRALGTNLKGDADAVRITALVARQDFHTGRPWAFDGSKLTLGDAA